MANRLHRESRPFRWDTELFTFQKEAIIQIHELLEEIWIDIAAWSRRAEDRRVEHALVQLIGIDPQRSNRVVLIDGGRGTSKSSVLVTMVDLWSRNAVHKDPTRMPEEIRRRFGKLTIIPTPIIDIQPLPENAHLMLHVGSHLRRLSELVGAGGGALRPRDALESEKKWEAFAQTAAKVWQPRNDRSSRLPPEDLAEELTEVEVNRLGLNKLFHAFVNALVEDLKGHLSIGQDVLLAVPIDDADLNPWRATEVLDLVRWLHHPQVVFVLAGDGKMLERVVHADLLGRVGGPLRGLPITQQRFESLFGWPSTHALANDIYDKIIPPSHRARLPGLSGKDRLATVKDVRETLDRLELDGEIGELLRARLAPHVPSSLAGYLELAGLEEALPAELRRLFHFIEDLTRSEKADVSDVALELARVALRRANLSGTEPGSMSKLDIAEQISRIKFSLSQELTHSLAAPGEREIYFEIVDAEAEVQAYRRKEALPSELAHSLMLFADLESLRSRTDNPALPACKAVVSSLPSARAHDWPVPRFRYHAEQRGFLRDVNKLREECGNDEARFVAGYLSMVLQLDAGAERGPALVERGIHWVLDEALKLFNDRMVDEACEIIEVVSPEAGTSYALAARWLDLAEDVWGGDWESLTSALRERRGDRARSPALVYRHGHKIHPWHAAVESRVRFIGPVILSLTSGGLELSSHHLKRLRRLLRSTSLITIRRLLRARPTRRPRSLLTRLWRSLPQRFRTSAISIKLTNGKLHVEPGGDPWSALQASSDRDPVTGSLDVTEVKLEDHAATTFSNQLVSPSAQLIYELAWDLAVNDGTARVPEAPPWRSWPGLWAAVGGARPRSMPWIVPSFATYTDVALLAEGWNRICQKVRTFEAPGAQPELADRVALSFISWILEVCNHSSSSPREHMLLPIEAGSWASTAARVEASAAEARRSRRRRPDRLRALEAWARVWRLFAAPELGLSEEAAAAILKGRSGAPPNKTEQRVLRRAREELCKAAGVTPDRSREDHPWQLLVESAPRRRARRS